MIEPTQILLFAVVTVLTIILVLIGWQIILILAEVRKMIMKFNTMVDNAVSISGSVGKSFEKLSGVSEGVSAVFSLFRMFSGKKDKKKKEVENDE